jgi:hypothetical protein
MEFANEISRSRYYRLYSDLELGVLGDALLYTTTGAGAANTAVAPQSADQIGVVQHDMGTTTTGQAGWTSSLTAYRMDAGGKWKLEIYLRSGAALSDGTDTYTIRAGFIDSAAAEPTDGVYFRYIHSANSGKWLAVTRANNVETTVDTGVTFAINTNYRLNIEVLADGSKAFFSINGIPVASQTLTIPVGAGRETSVGAFALKSAGTTSRSFFTDYVDAVCVFR